MHIRNPVEWGVEQLRLTVGFLESVSLRSRTQQDLRSPPLVIRKIGAHDLLDVLSAGLVELAAYRTDVIVLGAIYPVVGLILARLAFGYDMLPLLFPLASGFALVGPFAAVGLYEMSRRREQGLNVTWADAFGVVRSRAFGAIVVLGVLLTAIFLLWLGAAEAIYRITLGPEPPASIAGFAHDVLTTSAGWTLIVVGVGVGFLFAVLVLLISVVSFPLLLDREVGLDAAVLTSARAVIRNPRSMALWGLIVAGGLVIGSIPFFLGLIIVVPMLGHATWHLYRKLVQCPEDAQHNDLSYRGHVAPRDLDGNDHAALGPTQDRWPRVFPGL